MTREPTPLSAANENREDVGALLDRFTTNAPPLRSAGAAVFVLLRQMRHDVETLLLERTVQPGDLASGQVSLPGGRVNEGDRSLKATALRELHEEVGLTSLDLSTQPRYVNTEIARVFSLRVAVFSAALSPRARRPIARSETEVADVFWLPRSALREEKRVSRETVRGLREVETTVYRGHVVWGFTRRVLQSFFGFPVTVREGSPPEHSRRAA